MKILSKKKHARTADSSLFSKSGTAKGEVSNDVYQMSPMDPQVPFITKRSQKNKKKVDALLSSSTISSAVNEQDRRTAVNSEPWASVLASHVILAAAHKGKDQPSMLGPGGSTSAKKGTGRFVHTDNSLLRETTKMTRVGRNKDGMTEQLAAFLQEKSTVGEGIARPSAEHSVVQKKKRDRPRKDAPETLVVQKKKRDRPRKDAPETSVVQKKKRGRPRRDSPGGQLIDPFGFSKKKSENMKKNDSKPTPLISPVAPAEGEGAEQQVVDTAGGLEDTDKPVVDSQVAPTTSEHNTQPPAGEPVNQKRKRGRPKEEDGAQPSAGQQVILKRKRGRPKKEDGAQPSAGQPVIEKRKRGRPKKKDGAHPPAGDPVIEKRKRGRPKKDRSDEPPSDTKVLSKKTRKVPYEKNDIEKEPTRSARSRGPWKWHPCQKCLACTRLSDCGKCGQCNAQIGRCILRQCIAPTRAANVLLPKILPSDDESLASPESDVSDLEWDVAFPENRFGSLSRRKLWQGLLSKQSIAESHTENGVCI